MSKKYATIKAELTKLLTKHGHLTPELIVEEASKKTSKLHPFFTWDQQQAAHEWRLYEARHYIGQIRIKMEAPSGKEVTTREFVHIPAQSEDGETPNKNGKGEWYHIDTVLADEKMKQSMLAQAMRELTAFQRKYEALEELAPIFRVIDRIKKKTAVG